MIKKGLKVKVLAGKDKKKVDSIRHRNLLKYITWFTSYRDKI